MKHRVFVAIKISKDLQKKIEDWQKNQKIKSIDRVRWTKPKNLHVTLIAPWYESDVEEVSKRLTKLTGKFKPFTVRFEKVTFGPNPGRPRLVWAEGKAPGDIIRLKKRLEKILNRPVEKRSFRLHLTLARFRGEDLNLDTLTVPTKIDWSEKVSSVTLFQSRLSPRGSDYRPLKTIKV